MCSASGAGRCFIEEYLEISAQDSQPHPDMNAPKDGEGVNFQNTFLATGVSTWRRWDSTYASNGGRHSPYSVCWASKYDALWAGKALTCTADETPEP
ncbi:MAG: hypothetical protein M3321_04150 [Actinomycetota bacterium]|nr:hypothetical protein [Actinomycetota bacterium]